MAFLGSLEGEREHKSVQQNILSMNYESRVEVRLQPPSQGQRDFQIPCCCLRPCRRSPQRTSGSDSTHPIRVATALSSPHLIPAAAGGKLQEEIGVVPPVSDTALVLDYLNGPLPPLCALTLGDLGLSVLSALQSGVCQCTSLDRCLLN